jgi:hypothetical protein
MTALLETLAFIKNRVDDSAGPFPSE